MKALIIGVRGTGVFLSIGNVGVPSRLLTPARARLYAEHLLRFADLAERRAVAAEAMKEDAQAEPTNT